MKRRYDGLSKTFYKGYEELAYEDFLQVEDEDLSTYNLADKIHVQYNIGNLVKVPFE